MASTPKTPHNQRRVGQNAAQKKPHVPQKIVRTGKTQTTKSTGQGNQNARKK